MLVVIAESGDRRFCVKFAVKEDVVNLRLYKLSSLWCESVVRNGCIETGRAFGRKLGTSNMWLKRPVTFV